ncbi:hypothetical protein Q9966_009174, partial [Columba livia]
MLFRCIRMLHGRAPGQRDSKQRWIARVRSKPVIMKEKDIHFEVPFEKEDIPFEI